MTTARLALLLGALIALPLRHAAALEPQAQALTSLQAASAVPVSLQVRAGFPLAMSMDVGVPGADSVAVGREFFEQYGDLFLLGPDVALVPQRVSGPGSDDLVSFTQTYKGIPVWASRISLFLTPSPVGGPSRVRLAVGALLSGRGDVQVGTVPALSATQAIELARAYLGRPGAAAFADPELQVYDPGLGGGGASSPRLVYVLTLGGGDSTEVLVDANTGAIAFSHSFVRSDYYAGFLDALGSPGGFNTTCYDPDLATVVGIGNENGLISSYLGDVDAVNAWWHARNTYLWYWGVLGRDSWDDDGSMVRVYVHAGIPNGGWVGGCNLIEFSNGWVGYDGIVHEFTHGVVQEEADLVYAGEPGALDESYADTMGAIADSADWLIGEDRTNGWGAIRSLSNPPAALPCGCPAPPCSPCGQQPDEDSEYLVLPQPCTGGNDNCGVHTNSGIFNKAHYLMAAGGPFRGRTMVGMGRTKLAWLAYLSLASLPANSSLPQAAGVTRAVASWLGNTLFTNQDVCDVNNALAAVGYGTGDTDCDGISDLGDDSDGDGFVDLIDNCDSVPNPSQQDSDSDGVGDSCDDSDGDGISDAGDNCPGVYNPFPQMDQDMDGIGDVCDLDRDGDGVADSVDNCDLHPNPGQQDGNANGEGNACDPDTDGDGYWDFSAPNDNCTFVPNPMQTDTDLDGMGDACDLCPNTQDNSNAYTIPPCAFPPNCANPVPYQPDNDGDGIPNACDSLNFGPVGMDFDTEPMSPTRPIRADGTTRDAAINLAAGVAGVSFQIPLGICDPGAPFLRDELAELQFSGLDPLIDAWVADQRGRRVARAVMPVGSPVRGLRFRPNCARRYFLHFELSPALGGGDDFQLLARRTPGTTPNPWRLPSPFPGDPPPPTPDLDMDGLPDSIDSCPTLYEPTATDTDADGVAQVCDTCTLQSNPPFSGAAPGVTFVSSQHDGDGDGRGNRCDFDYNNAGLALSPSDFNDMKFSLLPSAGLVTQSTCGATTGPPPAGEGGSGSGQRCAEFDHDGSGAVITSADFNLSKAAVAAGGLINTNFPKCASCNPPYSAPPGSDSGVLAGKPVCIGPACQYLP